ncbi:O-antigen ligase family protein [Leptospira sp. 201903070]|uniref:O-antigen ligase family protein n=1 Tax=Leptospira ainlahdjerensis TaxID=2810033 RepID=A0ABS2UIM7_9LEPT|nr:O-antigen ligase family protein [Leptospira ainlahdjerensis]MBM9578855.1 O-antigen ligase family protein [Leptospira ainlahdjerensis]
MQNRKQNPFFSFIRIPAWKIFFWIGFSLLLLVPLLGFYPWKYRIVFVLSIFLFVLIDLFSPLVATAILAGTSVFFGNHPGGRFLEFQDSLWIFWSVRGIVELKFSGSSVFTLEFWKRPLGVLLLCFFASGFLSLLANPELVSDLRFYQKGWFWFLHSTELEPWYPIKLLTIGILFWIGLNARREWLSESQNQDQLLIFYALGIGIGLGIAVFAGWLEYFFPFVKSKLDVYHLWLDGYKLVAKPHAFFPWMQKLQAPFAIQSLFWNRSWFAVTLISALPFLFYLLNRSGDQILSQEKTNEEYVRISRRRNRIRILVLSGIFLVLGLTFLWIGARGGMFSFAVLWIAAGVFFLFFRTIQKESIRKTLFRSFILFFIFCGIGFPILIIYTKLGAGDPERLSHFRAGWKLFLAKPLLGGGFESYGWYNECCLSQIGRESPFHTTHNQWLQILSGLGVFGGIIFGALWAFLLDAIGFPREKKEESIGARALYFGSFVAIFVYSFFQEWFYIRGVYLQWIALFVFFGFGSRGKINYNIKIFKNISVLGVVFFAFVLLVVSVCFFPTRLFRSGVYFPPGVELPPEGKPRTAWILEGRSSIVLVNEPDSYSVFPQSDDPDGISKIDIKGGYLQSRSFPKSTDRQDVLIFRTVEGENILKLECGLGTERNELEKFVFWKSRILDPEPRKICGRILIEKHFL